MKARFGKRKGDGSYSEVIWNENSFTLDGTDYDRDPWNGRCYYLSTPHGFYTRLVREGGLARYRIGAKRFAELQKECETRVAGYETLVAKRAGGAV